jgi:hypothetical protein
MPCVYRIDAEQRLVVSTASGHVTFEEAITHQDRLKNDPHFLSKFDQLLDATLVTKLEISTEEAKILAKGSLFFAPSSRRAWIAPNPVIFGIGRLIEAHREIAGPQDRFCVFYDLVAALQ